MRIISISEMKSNAANLRDEIGDNALFVTQNGNQSLVVMSDDSYAAMMQKHSELGAAIDDLWPDDERINAIGQNGNTGEHYKGA